MKEFILVVDDDKDICRLLGIYLGNEGYRYLTCENAVQALDILEHYQVDLILMDVMMPGIDGISACLQIREKSRMPIIFMSAKSEDIDIIQGIQLGVHPVAQDLHGTPDMAQARAGIVAYLLL